jgi:hypothetical protein
MGDDEFGIIGRSRLIGCIRTDAAHFDNGGRCVRSVFLKDHGEFTDAGSRDRRDTRGIEREVVVGGCAEG